MALRLYSTLTRDVKPFAPARDNTVRMYTCGPTVYDYAHIGNFRTFVFFDILRKWLRASGFTLDHVQNITDIDDKIIRNAMARQQSLADYTAVYTEAFFADAKLLRLETPEHVARATEHIPQMAHAIHELERKGFTYQSDGSTYFRIANFPEYGKLSHNDFTGNRAGARVDVDEYDKDDARDFVLWKAPKDDEPFWETEVGNGRPGWHIECSVMALEYLGETLDIHAGGIDLTFPHHENEIAQSESLTGRPFARFWMHAEFLLVEGQKMSKSLGNFFTLRDILEKGYSPETVRYLLTSVPYRKSLNFTFEGLKSAATAIDRLRNYEIRLNGATFPPGLNEAIAGRTEEAARHFASALDDDLNTAEALAAVFEYVRETNSAMDAGAFASGNVEAARLLLSRFDSVFDVLQPTVKSGSRDDAGIEALVKERNEAKRARNFARADELRNQLSAEGILLEDTKDGVRWKRKST